jgi:hypothetical protein
MAMVWRRVGFSWLLLLLASFMRSFDNGLVTVVVVVVVVLFDDL